MLKREHKTSQAQQGKLREKVCMFCRSKATPKWQDYENLKEYLSPRGRILGRTITFVCAHHQRRLAQAIKQARHLGLLPFVTLEE